MAHRQVRYNEYHSIIIWSFSLLLALILIAACNIPKKEEKNSPQISTIVNMEHTLRTPSSIEGTGIFIPHTQIEVKHIPFNRLNWINYSSIHTQGMAQSVVYDIALEQDGSIWAATSKGVSRFHQNIWKTFTTVDGLPDNATTAVAVDQKGIVWVGSRSGKVTSFDGSSWAIYPSYGQSITTILIDKKGTKWFGLSTGSEADQGDKDGGVLHFDGVKWHVYRTTDGLLSDNVWDIAEDVNGDLWFATGKGISHFDGKIWRSYPPDLFNFSGVGQVSTLSIDRDGAIWFFARTRLYQYKNGLWTQFDTEPILTGSTGVSSTFISNANVIWISNSSGKTKMNLSIFDGSNWSIFDDVPIGHIYDIEQDLNGNMWFATAGGVACYKTH